MLGKISEDDPSPVTPWWAIMDEGGYPREDPGLPSGVPVLSALKDGVMSAVAPVALCAQWLWADATEGDPAARREAGLPLPGNPLASRIRVQALVVVLIGVPLVPVAGALAAVCLLVGKAASYVRRPPRTEMQLGGSVLDRMVATTGSVLAAVLCGARYASLYGFGAACAPIFVWVGGFLAHTVYAKDWDERKGDYPATAAARLLALYREETREQAMKLAEAYIDRDVPWNPYHASRKHPLWREKALRIFGERLEQRQAQQDEHPPGFDRTRNILERIVPVHKASGSPADALQAEYAAQLTLHVRAASPGEAAAEAQALAANDTGYVWRVYDAQGREFRVDTDNLPNPSAVEEIPKERQETWGPPKPRPVS